MAKKDKKFDAPAQPQDTPVATQTQTAPAGNGEAPAEGKTVGIPKAPAMYLEDEQGVQYKFTRFPLPKRAAKTPDGEFKCTVDGQEVPVWTTASKGWAADDAQIDYIWFDLPQASGENVTGYITLDYGVAANTFNDVIFKSGTGKANREDPKRVPKDKAKEDNRIAQFQAKMAAKKEETPAEQPTAAD